MKKGLRTGNRLLSWLLAVAMVITMLPVSAANVKAETSNSTEGNAAEESTNNAEDDSVSLIVNGSPKIEVALAVGQTDLSYANFKTDLTDALTQLQIPTENISFQEVDAKSAASQSKFTWARYDHSDNASYYNNVNYPYVENIGNQTSNPCNTQDFHIATDETGTQMTFYGYGSSGYKDFNFMSNAQATKKTIEFTIEEDKAQDALDGFGFLINSSITGSPYATASGTVERQKLNGYLVFFQYNGNTGDAATTGKGREIRLFQLKDVNTYDLHHTMTGATFDSKNVTGATLLATATTSYSSGHKYRKIKMEIDPTYVKMWYAGASSDNSNVNLNDSYLVYWDNNKTVSSYPLTKAFDVDKNSNRVYRGGYGPLSSYRSHNCSAETIATLKNLSMTSEYVRSLTEVVREPSWNSDRLSFLVNLNESKIEAFSDVYSTSEIINRLQEDNVSYIGWCGTNNAADSLQFVEGVANGSALVNMNDTGKYGNDPYSEEAYKKQILAIAQAIKNRINTEYVTTTGTYLTTDNFKFTPSGAKLDDGSWSVGYATDSFANAKANISNYQNLENASFAQAGYYEIYYQNDTDHPKARLRIHEAPVAAFTATISQNGIAAINKSYDKEKCQNPASATGSIADGIAESTYEYKELTSSDSSVSISEWKKGLPSSVVTGTTYLVRLTVKDEDGATNSTVQQLVLTDTSAEETQKIAPYGAFSLSKTQYIRGIDNTIDITDKSYMLDGSTDFTVTYKIMQGTIAQWTSDTEKFKPGMTYSYVIPDSNSLADGTYKMVMTASNRTAKSAEVSRTFTISTGYKVEYMAGAEDDNIKGLPTTQYKIKGNALQLSSVAPSRTGYIFDGWTGSDAKTYGVGGTYSTDAALTLTAKWLARTSCTAAGYTGVYDGNAHGITVSVTEPATDPVIKYGTADGIYDKDSLTYTNAGVYTIYYQVSKSGYQTVTGFKTVSIKQAEPKEVKLLSKVYNEETQSPQGVDSAKVTGIKDEEVTGNISYTYYTDKELKNKTTSLNGSTSDGSAPSKKGHYYVKAKFEGNTNYIAKESNVVTLDIAPDVYYYNAAGTKVYGTLEDVLTATDNPTKKIYIESSMSLNDNVTIPASNTLFIASGATLTVPGGVTLTNNGTIRNNGKIEGEGKVVNNKSFYSGEVAVPFENNGNVYGTEFAAKTPITNNKSLNDCSGGQVTNGENGTVKNNDEVVTYTVTFDATSGLVGSNNVTNPKQQEIPCGNKAIDPAIENIVGKAEFQGWYKENTYENEWDFATDTVNGNITLYAKWKEYATFEAYWTDEDGKHYGTFEQVLEEVKKAKDEGKTGIEIHIQNKVSPDGNVTVPNDVPVVIDEGATLTLKPNTTFNAPGGITNNGTIKASGEPGAEETKPVIDGGKTGIENNSNMTGIKADSDVNNNAGATITGSEITGDLDNSGTVEGSTTSGKVTNHEDGTLKDTSVTEPEKNLKNEGKYTDEAGNEQKNTVTYHVESEPSEGVRLGALQPESVVYGGLASFKRPTVTAQPDGTDLVFSGWYKENQYQNKWNFAKDVVTANVELYTKLQPASVFEAYWKDPNDPTGGMTYGTLTDALASESTMVTIRKDITLPAPIEIPENMTVVVNGDVTVTIPDGGIVNLEGTLLNNGTIDNGGVIRGNGQVTNSKSKTINGGEIQTSVVNEGTIYQATLSGPVTNNEQIVSSELSNEVTNNGTIYGSKLTKESHVTNNKNISGCDIQGEVENEGDGKIIDNNFSEVSYEVTFNLNGYGGDNTPEKKTIGCGKKIEEPARILDQDYYLTGWYLDQACTESKKWNFATNTVSKPITLYAGWKLKTSYEACWVNEDGETEYGTLLEAAQAAEAAKDTENKVSEIFVQNDASVSEPVTLPEGTKLVVQSGVTVTVEAGVEMDVPGGIENNGTIKAGAETGEKPQITGPVENKKDASIQGCDITGNVTNQGVIKNSSVEGDVTNSGAIEDTVIKAENVTNDGRITRGSIAGKDDATGAKVTNNMSGSLAGVGVTGDVTNDGSISDNTTVDGKTTNGEKGKITNSTLNGDVYNSGTITDTAIQAENVTNDGSITGSSIAGKDNDTKATVTNGEKGTIENSDLSGQKVNNEGTLKNNNLSDANVDNTNGTMTGEGDEAITHTVTFDLNGHGDETQAPEVQTVAYDKKATCPPNPQDDEFTMTGWYLDAEYTEEQKWDFAANTVRKDIVLYAKWELRSGYEAYWTVGDEQRYGSLEEALQSGSNNVTIQKNVTLPSDMQIPEGMTVTIPDKVVVTIPEGTTVTVSGKLNNEGTIYNDGEIAGSGTVNNKKTIYGGSIASSLENSGKIDGTDITGPVTNSGRITDSTLTNTVVNENGGAITDSKMSGNVTNDGTISGGELTESSSITNNKNISGCDIKGNVVNTDSGKIVDSSLEGIQYTVRFTRNGRGEDIPVENVPDAQIIGCGCYVEEPDAIKDTDYVFIGWYKEAECQNKWNFNTDTVNGDITLYAKWREKTTYEAYWINEAGEFEYGTFEEVLKAANEAGATQIHVQGETVVTQPLAIPEGMQVTVDPEAALTFGEGGSLTVNGMLTNQGTITGVSGNGEPQIIGNVTNASDAKIQNCGLRGNVENAGSISGSAITGNVNVTNTGSIANSAITGELTNAGSVRETTLQGNLNNAAGGELDNSVVNGNVDNAGKISGGSIVGETVHNSGEMFAAEIETASMSNDGTVSGGSIAGKEGAEATVTNSADARLDGVTVTGNVTNDGTITNGSTISGTTTNNGTITDSTLNGTVDNKGTLENSDFEGAEVDNTEGTVIKGDNDQTLSYMVSFNTGSYGEAPQSQTVEYGKKATCPLDPVDETYAFAGWYQDEACTQPFDFNVTVIKKPTTIYGKWVSKSETEAYWTVGNETKYGTLKEALASGSKDVHITKKLEIAEDITIPEGVTVTVESGVTVSVSQDKKVTVAKDAQLINNGIVKNNGTIAGDGTVINNKNITGGTVDTDITNNGTVNSVELNGQVTNNKAINDCEINAGLDNQNGTVSKDGDQIVYTDTQLKGTVVKETGDMQQTQANATVKLMQGNKVIQEVKTAADGTYDLAEVPSGIYNLVIESAEGNTNTLLAQVNGNAIQMKEIKLPEGNLNNTVVVEEGAPDVVVGGLDLILTEDVATQDTEGITQADKEVVQNGGSIEVSFVTKQLDKIPADELDMEKVIDEDNKTPGMNLDLSVLKSVKEAQGDVEETRLTDLKNPIMVNIPIDKELQGKKNYIVYRFHDGEVDRITENADDGEYIEVQEGGTAITLYAKKFSTYVLAYEKEKTPDTDKPGENPTQPGQNPADGSEDKKPDAGNNGNETGQNPADGSDSQKDPYQNLTDEQKKVAQTLAAQLQLTAEQAVELVQFAQANGIETDTLLVTENTILAQAKDADIKGASFARIQAWSSKEKTNAVSLKWNKVKGADGYLIYGNQCGKKIKYITTLTGRKTSFTQKKLQKGTYYKYVVCAYKQIGDKKVTIALSKTIHSTTKGGKYGVAKSVKVNKSTVSIKQGKTFRLKAKEVKKDKKIKQHRKVVFESSNPAVATVSKKGVIKGVQKGRCYVYAYAQNGVYKRIKVSVK